MPEINAWFPPKTSILFEKSRYKVLYGGRGGGKSWAIARALLIKGRKDPLRILCAREFQSSVKKSVHLLLCDQIKELGFESFYDIEEATIKGKNGTSFSFIGIKNNISSLKSYEAFDICWVEEASNVSPNSWEKLIPTFRKPGSEIWVAFNPELEKDETYQRFIINTPPKTLIEKINYTDNDACPDILKEEAEYLLSQDPEAYNNVWLGFPRTFSKGAVYFKQITDAYREGRITNVPYTPDIPVHTFWDIGRRDKTCIWFAQMIGMQTRIINYYENTGPDISHYIEYLKQFDYTWGNDYLPHDAYMKRIEAKWSVDGSLANAGRTTKPVPKVSISDGINAARMIFPACVFDEEKCHKGLFSLKMYRFEDEESEKPMHDLQSHAADAFRYLAVSMKPPKEQLNTKKLVPNFRPNTGSQGWMR